LKCSTKTSEWGSELFMFTSPRLKRDNKNFNSFLSSTKTTLVRADLKEVLLSSGTSEPHSLGKVTAVLKGKIKKIGEAFIVIHAEAVV
jgi:hypothetical protein